MLQDQEINWITKGLEVELARRDFWAFCQLLAPDFYTDDRPHLKNLCDILQALYEGRIFKRTVDSAWEVSDEPVNGYRRCRKLMLNMPPQHGKTRTLIMFSSWVFGINSKEKIIVGSYNNDTASDFSRYTRDNIATRKVMADDAVFSDVFPATRIKQGNSGFEKWALEGNHFSYMGVGVGGSVTSKGASILIVDDPIKGAAEALNLNNLDNVWLWYTATFLSRVSAAYGEPIEIICMTRWSSEDICGRVLRTQEEQKRSDWYIIRMPACLDETTGEMLCPSLFSFNRYKELKGLMVDTIFNANYKQQTMEATGLLFYRKDIKRFKISDLPKHHDGTPVTPTGILAYADIADEGDDFYSCPCALIYGNKVYVVDVIFTRDNVDITIPRTAAMYVKWKTDYIQCESNGQGSVFTKFLRSKVDDPGRILGFVNTAHKHTRILNMYGFITTYCHFLDDSEYEPGSDYYLFMNNLFNYMKDGSSNVVDGPDSMAGLGRFIYRMHQHEFDELREVH